MSLIAPPSSFRDPDLFLRTMNDAADERLTQYEPVMSMFRSKVRSLARSDELYDRYRAAEILVVASSESYRRPDELLDEASRAPGSAEWKNVGTPPGYEACYQSVLHAVRGEGDPYSALRQLLSLSVPKDSGYSG